MREGGSQKCSLLVSVSGAILCPAACTRTDLTPGMTRAGMPRPGLSFPGWGEATCCLSLCPSGGNSWVEPAAAGSRGRRGAGRAAWLLLPPLGSAFRDTFLPALDFHSSACSRLTCSGTGSCQPPPCELLPTRAALLSRLRLVARAGAGTSLQEEQAWGGVASCPWPGSSTGASWMDSRTGSDPRRLQSVCNLMTADAGTLMQFITKNLSHCDV